ncbi:hypothetical protein BYT27DRAFT_7339600 [Phlegmacium glaucopus]|nr:hypothetical protein BYT27DRAFT_7339600 [Phlegmacium glaucopus]
MSSSTEPFLPFDIIENIIDIYINENANYLQNVRALSLISPLFLHLCRKYMFSSIRITVTKSSRYLRTTEAFGELLLTTPGIAGYIHKLRIFIVNPDIESRYFFSRVPQQLTSLQSLTVSNSFYSVLDWNLVSSSMHRSLLDLMHLPTLKYLHLGKMKNFLISDLIPCSNLKHLSVHELCIVSVSEDGDADDGAASSSLCHKPLQLQVFDLQTDSLEDLKLLEAKFSDGRPILDFTGMEKLFINFGWPGAAVPLQEIFKRSRELQDIHLKVGHACFRALKFATTITPCLETLRRVCLDINSCQSSNDPLAGLCDELEEDILGKNKLESIELEITLLIEQDSRLSDDWARLERILLKPGWPMLKQVFLLVIIYSDHRATYNRAIRTLLPACFNGLRSSKDFWFSIREEII